MKFQIYSLFLVYFNHGHIIVKPSHSDIPWPWKRHCYSPIALGHVGFFSNFELLNYCSEIMRFCVKFPKASASHKMGAMSTTSVNCLLTVLKAQHLVSLLSIPSLSIFVQKNPLCLHLLFETSIFHLLVGLIFIRVIAP